MMWIIAALIVIIAIAAAAGGAMRGYMLLDEALEGRRERPAATTHLSEFALREQMNAMQSASRMNGWLSMVQARTVVLENNLYKRYGRVFEPVRAGDSSLWALVLHGGQGTDYTQVLDVACELSLSGYRVLTPDLAAHGQSEGKWTSLGLREKEDVIAWVEWIKREDPLAEIVVFGQDEGAVAALLAAEDIDDAVRAIAADSVYLSAYERSLQMLEETKESLSGLDRLLFSAAYRAAFGDPADGNVIQAVRQCGIPVLFLYGTGDEDTPAWQGEDLMEAAGENGHLLLIEGAVHGMARYGDPQKYYDAVLRHFEEMIEKRMLSSELSIEKMNAGGMQNVEKDNELEEHVKQIEETTEPTAREVYNNGTFGMYQCTFN